MNLLAVDTSTRWAGVGLQADSGTQLETVWRSDQNHGRELMPAIMNLLEQANLKPADLTNLAVALGPGGFSAVRVGISTVIGLAMPGNLPVVGVSTHRVEAQPFLDSASASVPLISLLPAGRGELSWARFESPEGEPEIGLCSAEALKELHTSQSQYCGEGCDLIRGQIDNSAILIGDSPTRTPKSLLDIASERFQLGGTPPLSELRPIYARPPSVTMPKQPR